ncbi:FAD-binding oxidoreductase [Conyzicola nivalis]|uniref:FAD-linked oxidase n=1 Tax=Conyzicola nivalis TaxID=1477021 RepID=A0A916WF40_9MICO|nr:FAD-binding oxidoreductase [Conyzicola nivalis]GGA91790.1 FAD-linked oxidase [Conyzicola nivalis]
MLDREIDELRAVVTGELIVPGDPAYDHARRVWNAVVDRRPLAILRCASTDDVVAGVTFARTNRVPVAVRGGGHNVAGHGTVDDGLVLDLRALDQVEVDRERRTVEVGAGCTWGEVDAQTQRFERAVPGGVFSRTGVAGLALGGGYGWLRNAYGLSCASIVGAELVTANSEVVTVADRSHPDLLWAIRGGGGNVGVVTRFTFRLHAVGPEVYFLMVFHDARNGGGTRGLKAFRNFCSTAPFNVSLVALLGVVDEAAQGFAPEAVGTPFVAFAGVYIGDPDEGEHALRQLRKFGTPLLDASGTMPYVEAQAAFDDDYPDGGRYYWKSTNQLDLGDPAIDLITASAASPASRLSTVDVWHVAGAAAQPVDGAFATSRAKFLVNPEANWLDAHNDAKNIAWARGLVTALAPYSDGSRYLNFAGFQEEGDILMRSSFGKNYARLAAIKAEWDPENLFHLNQNVRPMSVGP